MATIDCPKCTGTMFEQGYADDVCIHRCDTCFGLWCSADMLKKMKKTWMADAVLDVGDPNIGKQLNRVDMIACPLGHGEMVATTDRNQRHVQFEECPTCFGVFLDAGEFTDLKHLTPADWVRDLLAHLRTREKEA